MIPEEPAGLNRRLKAETGGGVPFDWTSYCVNACNHFGGGRPYASMQQEISTKTFAR